MNLLHEVVLVCGALGLMTFAIAVMLRMSNSEMREIKRRREEWIAGGSIPEDEPKFVQGGGGGGGGS